MRIKQNLVLRHIGNDYVIIEPDKGMVDMATVFTLNETAAWLWKQLEGKAFTTRIVTELLLNQYGIEPDKASADAELLVDNLIKNGLIEE